MDARKQQMKMNQRRLREQRRRQRRCEIRCFWTRPFGHFLDWGGKCKCVGCGWRPPML